MFKESHDLLHIIEKNYDGGLKEFSKDGGLLLAFPDNSGTFLYHPSITNELKDTIKEKVNNVNPDFKIMFIDRINAPINPQRILAFNDAFNTANIIMFATTIALCIMLPVTYDKKEHLNLLESIKKEFIPEVYRMVIAYEDTFKIYINEDIINQPSTDNNKSNDSAQRNKYISDDEVTNLRIELETCTDVLDFINKI